MSEYTFKKVAADRALAVCQDVDLDEPGRSLLAPHLAPEAFLRLLMDGALYNDAVRFLARALPKREATWWACLCARGVLGDDPPADVVKALETAEQWVHKPTEENRRLTYPAAQTAQAAQFPDPQLHLGRGQGPGWQQFRLLTPALTREEGGSLAAGFPGLGD